MKLKKIIIKNYKQLKDVEIDLTYPRGHRKAGKPLDKICILGESGTGKTTLLRLIKWFISRDRAIHENLQLPMDDNAEVAMDFQLFDLHYRLISKGSDLVYHSFGKQDEEKSDDRWHGDFDRHIEQISPLLINYPADLMHLTGDGTPGKPGFATAEKSREEKIIDFSFDDIKKTWDFILKDIKEHRAKELAVSTRSIEAKKRGASMPEIQKLEAEYEKWLTQNPSPLENLAKRFLNPILHRLGLEVKTDFSYESIIDLAFIELQSLTAEVVQRDLWSTGTRQQVLTMLPLYQLKPQNAVILIDEPERSLYPDIQLRIADDYVKTAPQCQFFFATHSPFITASFEPWEIVDLKFDEKKMFSYRALDYTDENHVKNYKYHPHYLRWDSNVRHIFDVDQEGGKKREQALDKLADINIRIEKLKQENKFDSPEGRKLAKDYLKLSEKLDWRTTR